jgi:uncharacterized protein YaiE (UPF0345 family)
MERLDGVSVLTRANLYFDGRCVSHTVILADGSRKTLGVILPARLRFETREPECMELLGGACRVRLAGEEAWREYRAGERFEVPADSSFEIEVEERLDYLCHFG